MVTMLLSNVLNTFLVYLYNVLYNFSSCSYSICVNTCLLTLSTIFNELNCNTNKTYPGLDKKSYIILFNLNSY